MPDAGFWEEIARRVRAELWEPLRVPLAGLRRVACINHGDLHLLPVEAGAFPDLAVSRHAGLVFFAGARGLFGPGAGGPGDGLGILAYPGDGGDIPFATAEAESLAGLWGALRPRAALHHPSGFPESEEPLGLLHLACHGDNDPGARDRVVLRTGPGRFLGERQILAREAVPPWVYVSACLAGQTVEDLDGNPSGLVSALFRRGARVVAGALVEVPDLWSMVLALLTYQAVLERGLPLERALAEGKRRLASGDWPAGTEGHLRAAMQGAVAGQLAASVDWHRDIHGGPLCADCRQRLDAQLAVLLPEPQRREAVWSAAGPDTGSLAVSLAREAADAWLRDGPRVPPQPDLGTLLHGVVAYGEGA